MKHKISDAYIIVCSEEIKIGVVLGEENKPESPHTTDIITCSEYTNGLRCFKYGSQRIDDLVCHVVGKLSTDGDPVEIESKWIQELEFMGYDTSLLKYKLKD